MKKISLILFLCPVFLFLIGCVDDVELGLSIDTDKNVITSGFIKTSNFLGEKETEKITNLSAVNQSSVFKSKSAKIDLSRMPEVMKGLSYLSLMTNLIQYSTESKEVPPVYLYLSVGTSSKKIKDMSIQFTSKKLPLEKVENQEGVFKLNLIPIVQSQEMMDLVSQILNDEEAKIPEFYLNISYAGHGFTPLVWISDAFNAAWRAVSGVFLAFLALFK